MDIEPAEAKAARAKSGKVAVPAAPANGTGHARPRGLLTLFKRT
jgi:hypothetical protein